MRSGTLRNSPYIVDKYNTFSTKTIEVPIDFIGMHCHRYPIYSGSYDSGKPPFDFGTWRTHDSDIGGWKAINTAPGVYDWSKLDTCVDVFHTQQGKEIIYTVFGTPTWAAKTADALKQGPYGGYGELGVPADLKSLEDFIIALVTRYKGKINTIEIWNEPQFGIPNTNPLCFFWGTAIEMLQMGITISQAAKSIDPNITILSPGFMNSTTDILSLIHISEPTRPY